MGSLDARLEQIELRTVVMLYASQFLSFTQFTLCSINIDPGRGGLEDEFQLINGDFQDLY